MSSICLECGLCCNGTLFVKAAIEEGYDRGALAKAGASFSTDDENETVFSQPCRAFEGCCAIYEERPAACRSFRCALLRLVDSEEVSPDRARATIAATRGLSERSRSRLEALTEAGDHQPLDTLARMFMKQIELSVDPRAFRVANADLLADLTALDLMLSRHFRNSAPQDPSRTTSPG